MTSCEDYVQSLDIKAVCGSIALQNPYFAFLDLERKSDVGVRGTFAAEHRTGHERGPVAAAELVRHLATLGACAAVVNGASTGIRIGLQFAAIAFLPKRPISYACEVATNRRPCMRAFSGFCFGRPSTC
jgi:hypothetical protein